MSFFGIYFTAQTCYFEQLFCLLSLESVGSDTDALGYSHSIVGPRYKYWKWPFV